MRKPLKIALSLLAIALAVLILPPAIFLTKIWIQDHPASVAMPAAGSGDASRLTTNTSSERIELATKPAAAEQQLVALVQRASREILKISISGAQHSMGGHSVYPGGIALDMRAFNRMSLDAENRILTVGSGARWSEVIPFLDTHGFAVSVMQSNNDFSVGGSISVNCHGWQNDTPPIASTVDSFRLLTASGDILRCSRSENSERFSHALGGYGLFGVILDVDLRVVPNDFYQAEAQLIPASDYAETYRSLTQNLASVGMAYGRLSVAPNSFFEEASITLLRPQPSDRDPKNTLTSQSPSLLKRLVFRGGVGSDYGKNLRWFLEKQVGETAGQLLSRNEIMNEPSSLYANRDPDATDILHEYFIPPENLASFIARSREVFLQHRPELLNVTIRNVMTDTDTTLRYAPEQVFGLVMLFHQKRDPAAEAAMQRLTQDLIAIALDCHGRYYLPYRPHATLEQFLAAYPQAPDFFATKLRHDPQEIFVNRFYQTYGQPLLSANAAP